MNTVVVVVGLCVVVEVDAEAAAVVVVWAIEYGVVFRVLRNFLWGFKTFAVPLAVRTFLAKCVVFTNMIGGDFDVTLMNRLGRVGMAEK